MATYVYTEAPDYRETFDAASDNDADLIARGKLRDGEYEPGDPPATFRVTGHVTRLGPGGVEEDGWGVTLDIDPDEPPCPVRGDDGHDWQNWHSLVGGLPENPGVFTSGHGQVETIEACAACGARKTDDLGGTDRATGDPMRVLTYEPPGTVTPPGRPVYWSVCSGSGPGGVAAAEPAAAGVAIPQEIQLWAARYGLSADNPDVYLLVATEDEAQSDVPGEIAFCKGTVTYAEDAAIRAHLAEADIPPAPGPAVYFHAGTFGAGPETTDEEADGD